MTVSVLIVDDSGFFRRRLSEMISVCPDLRVAGVACNGQQAIELAAQLKPDVITMDYEMPLMDGITAVRHIMQTNPIPILMFSSLTYQGARVALDSLEAGAVDFLPKNFEEISKSSSVLMQKLEEKIKQVAGVSFANSAKPLGSRSRRSSSIQPSKQQSSPALHAVTKTPRKKYNLVAIGTSTGGPVALQKVLTALPASFSTPIVVIQHMPATFTAAFAERLNALCAIKVKEAVDGDQLQPGFALVAPGGKQLMIASGGRVKVLPGDRRLNYKPCVDITLGSAANVFADKVLAVILTGMGKDGCKGAALLKTKGATVWSQDESTSVIYGMPMAVAKANLTDEVLPIEQIGVRLIEAT